MTTTRTELPQDIWWHVDSFLALPELSAANQVSKDWENRTADRLAELTNLHDADEDWEPWTDANGNILPEYGADGEYYLGTHYEEYD